MAFDSERFNERPKPAPLSNDVPKLGISRHMPDIVPPLGSPSTHVYIIRPPSSRSQENNPTEPDTTPQAERPGGETVAPVVGASALGGEIADEAEPERPVEQTGVPEAVDLGPEGATPTDDNAEVAESQVTDALDEQANRNKEPRLEDVLQLQATIEAVPRTGLRQLSATERVALNIYPEGFQYTEGKVISGITKTQRQPNGRYEAVMNYIILRDGDETTTRVVKRPSFSIPSYRVELNAQEADDQTEKVNLDASLYRQAQQMGLYDLTAGEVRDLAAMIESMYIPKDD
jgi:hypothetical protein